jgi:hypothetical protein
LDDGRIRRERPADTAVEFGWVRHRSTGGDTVREEHAEWLSGAKLGEILGASLVTRRVVDTPEIARLRLQRLAARAGGHFVAVTDEDGRFQRLIDRAAIIEQLARELAERDN